MSNRLPLGAPGIYRYPEKPQPALGPERMDVAAFVGVAPRGPAREPLLPETWRFDAPSVGLERGRTVAVPVESFDGYLRLFGGFEGPGLLPYAVASFFQQGGRRAYIARIVHDYGGSKQDAGGVASGPVAGVAASAGVFAVQARNEGSWGNGLRAALGFTVTALELEAATQTHLTLAQGEGCVAGSLLRLTLPDGSPALRFATRLRDQALADGSFRTVVTLDQALPSPPLPDRGAAVVEGIFLVDDAQGNAERHERTGLSRQHPRWLATVLCYESGLVWPDPSWADGHIIPDDPASLPREPRLPDRSDPGGVRFQGGEDRWADITPDDFFDDSWVLGDPEPGDGVHSLTQLGDLSALVVPDLYCAEPLPASESVVEEPSLAGPTFAPCVGDVPPSGEQETAAPKLAGLLLDPRDPADLDTITGLQSRLVDFAETLRSFVVLLDVPPGLSQHQIVRWRSRYRSSYTAAYHPWLRASFRQDRRDALIRLNPSAAAAGIIAKQELRFGVPHGPANVLVEGAVDVEDWVSPARHDELHPLGINVFLRERDGIRLTAGRTLSRDARLRQLSVRRLMLQLRRVLERQTHWMVFEPNGPALQADVRTLLRNYLSALYRVGAFRGAREEEAFFVRCDQQLNPPRVVDRGQLIAEVGVAPSEPLEFIVLRLTRGGDQTLALEV